MNKVILIGNMGTDPELRHTASGRAVTNVRLATNEVYGSGDDRKEITVWHNLVFWGGQAETIAKHAKKGQTLSIDGHLRVREVERDLKGEKVKYERAEVYVDRFQFIGARKAPTASPTDEVPPFAEDGSTQQTQLELDL